MFRNSETLVSTLLEENPALLRLVIKFAASIPDTLTQLEQLIENKSYADLKNDLHKFKGTAGNFGFPKLSDILARMEFQALNENDDELQKLYQELEKCCQQVQAGLEKVQQIT